MKRSKQYTKKPVLLAENEIRSLVEYYKEAMCLGNWDIRVYVLRMSRLRNPNAYGHVEYDLNKWQATIEILHPDDYTDSDRPYDMEFVLVHELAHLHVAPFGTKPDSDLERYVENLVNSWAKSIVSVKRDKHSAMR